MKGDRRDGVVEWIDRLRMAAMKSVSEDDMRAIFQRIVEQAKRGDKESIKLLMTYLQPPKEAGPPVLPAQQVKANTVNIYPGPRKKKPKLLRDDVLTIENRNGA